MADSRLIPPGIRDASTLAINELIDRLGLVPLDQLLINLVDNVTAGALPHLADQFHITGLEGWGLCTTDDERRSLIRRAIALHRKKGTPWAVKEGLKGVGFGSVAINERLPALLYNGTQVYSGSEEYGAGADWARFSLQLDLGETRGVSAAETALIRAVVAEWKNERSHLDNINFSATTTDTATIAETTATRATDTQAEVLPWGVRYDGSRVYNSGRALAYDGTDTYAGAIGYSMSIPGDLQYDNAWDALGLALHADESDRVTTPPTYDGLASYDGLLDMGATLPPMRDGRMTMNVRRNYLYNGAKTYGSGKEYAGAMEYRGIHIIEEAAL